MADNNIRSDPAKKCYTLSISEEEIEKQLSIIFDSQICAECGQDRSFKNSFQDVETSIDYLPAYPRHQTSIVIFVTGEIGI
jgi:hypothetical protein